MTDQQPSGEEQLKAEVSRLAVDEILALCYTFKKKLERLRVYLDVLRGKGGERAQFASCLICFDLARQGEASFQQEFVYLADSMRSIGQKHELVDNLLGEDPYLTFLWELCQAQLAELDPRFAAEPLVPQEQAEVATVDLLSDADFEDFGIAAVDDSTLWLQLDVAVEDFLGGEVGMPIYDPDAGFRMRSGRDVERVERFLQELASLREMVPLAKGLRALALLFYGTHMRSKSIFGAINQRKQEALREGVAEFVGCDAALWEVAGIFNPLHTGEDAWPKIADVMLDYLAWLADSPDEAKSGPPAYDAVERMVARQPRFGNRRRGDRQ